MTISESDDDDPRKGIAVLTTLGRTKKKGVKQGQSEKEKNEEKHKQGDAGFSKILADNEARLPIELSPPLQTNAFPDSVLGPPQKTKLRSQKQSEESSKKTHDFDRVPKRSQGRGNIFQGTEFVKASSLMPIPEKAQETLSNDPVGTNKSTLYQDTKPKDYSMRSKMITERIRFEIVLESADNVDVRTKALVIFGKLINVDPSRKILAYNEDDEDSFPLLEKSHDLPLDLDKMSKYLAAPMLHPKAKRLQFHARFRSVTSLLEMKRDQDFMTWLKSHQIYTSMMTLNSTENTRAGFFLGKGPHITNLAKFSLWIRDRLTLHSTNCPEFQLNIEGIGRHKDPSTKSRAIVVICSTVDVRKLRDMLDAEFHSRSNFPFIPFPVMYSLETRIQNSLYKTHKARTFGPEMLEIGIPDFSDIDTKVKVASKPVSLRDVCFDLQDEHGQNIFVDVDNATRTETTVFQVRKEDKPKVLAAIDKWIKLHFHLKIQWNNDHHFEAKTYRLDAKYRTLANQFSELANNNLPKPTKNPTQYPTNSNGTKALNTNAWVDLTKVKEPPTMKSTSKMASLDEEATVTTLTDSTWHSSMTKTQAETTDKFKAIGRNVRQLSYRHKKVEADQECLESSVALKLNELFRCFEVHHNRLERLEAARERHLAIQMHHLQITLDSNAARKDGTLESLKKMLQKETEILAQDSEALENDQVEAFEGDHDEDLEFLEKKEKAGRCVDHYQAKSENFEDEDSDFDIRYLSDVSDDETVHTFDDKDKECKPTNHVDFRKAADMQEKNDQLMPDVSEAPNSPSQANSYTERAYPASPNDNTVTTSPIPNITTWGSEDELEPQFSPSSPPITQPTPWTTTPARQRSNKTIPSPDIQKPTPKPYPKGREAARNLLSKVFRSMPTANRFSALDVLDDDHHSSHVDTATMSTRQDASTEVPQETSFQDSEYEDQDSLDDESFDGMSLVSGSEIQGLEDDLLDNNEDGYDTETTDNTSPSKTSSSHRISSKQAKKRIRELYTSSDPTALHLWDGATPDSSVPTTSALAVLPENYSSAVTNFPHPSHNTTSQSEGPGAKPS